MVGQCVPGGRTCVKERTLAELGAQPWHSIVISERATVPVHVLLLYGSCSDLVVVVFVVVVSVVVISA